MKQCRTLWSLPPHHILYLPFICGKLQSKKINVIREVRNAETKENSQRTPNNNNILIEHSQGPLFPSLGP